MNMLTTRQLLRLWFTKKKGYNIEDGELSLNNGHNGKVAHISPAIREWVKERLIVRHATIVSHWNNYCITGSYAQYITSCGLTPTEYRNLCELVTEWSLLTIPMTHHIKASTRLNTSS